MISQKEIEKRFNKLLDEVKTNDFYKVDLTGRVNCYKCRCGHITKTKDIDAGVTPFIFNCEKCGKNSFSTFYKDIAPAQKPTFEWYRPALEQVLKMGKNPALLEHILDGGLDFRKC
jgi:hypothetical protein